MQICSSIAKGLTKSIGLNTLSMSKNALWDKSCTKLFESIPESKVTFLDISNNKLENAITISTMLSMESCKL